MKQLENSLETHEVYLEMLDICSIRYFAKFIVRILPMHAATVTHRLGYGL
jgi:hypothetical protein